MTRITATDAQQMMILIVMSSAMGRSAGAAPSVNRLSQIVERERAVAAVNAQLRRRPLPAFDAELQLRGDGAFCHALSGPPVVGEGEEHPPLSVRADLRARQTSLSPVQSSGNSTSVS